MVDTQNQLVRDFLGDSVPLSMEEDMILFDKVVLTDILYIFARLYLVD